MLVEVTERARPKLEEMLKEKGASAFRVVFKGFG